MNTKKNNRIICISILILIILLSSISYTFAATASELKNQQSDIDAKIDEITSEIKEVENQRSDALEQISSLNSEISTYQGQITNLELQIDGLKAQIEEKENNIKEQEEKFEKQKQLLEKRLVALYECGSVNYLEMLLTSGSLYEFISNYYLIELLAENDDLMLERIETTKNQIQAERDYIQSAKTELETTKRSMENKKTSLATSVSAKNALVSNLTAEEAELNKLLEEFEQDKKTIQLELAKIAAQDSGVKVSPGGYISPIAGKSAANITTGYGKYQTRSGKHTGVDWSCSAGTPILAVKAGTVVTSTALKRSNGTYKSYGEYVVINHHDGTMTLYAHMYPGSRMVKEGDTVYQGQPIGKVGTTGNSTGNHLHFEVRINGSVVNPTSYLP